MYTNVLIMHRYKGYVARLPCDILLKFQKQSIGIVHFLVKIVIGHLAGYRQEMTASDFLCLVYGMRWIHADKTFFEIRGCF